MKKTINILFAVVLITLFSLCGKKGESEPAPVAAFEAIVCTAPCEVVFINKSQNALTYKWDFGDGTSSFEANPRHKYEKNQSYTVTLEANSNSGTKTTSQVISLLDKPTIVDVNPVQSSGLIAYYTFEKLTKNIMADNFHGVNNNITFDTISPSKKGYSALFDPAMFSRMSIALNPFFDSNAGSICFWMRSFKTSPQAIIHGNSLADNTGFNLIIDKNILYNQYWSNNWGDWGFGKKFENFNTENILDGKWHFVAITIKPNEHRLYVDGDLIQNNSTTDGMLGTNINNGIIIGQFANSANYSYLYQGSLDNLRFYRRAITEAEVKEIFKNVQ